MASEEIGGGSGAGVLLTAAACVGGAERVAGLAGTGLAGTGLAGTGLEGEALAGEALAGEALAESNSNGIGVQATAVQAAAAPESPPVAAPPADPKPVAAPDPAPQQPSAKLDSTSASSKPAPPPRVSNPPSSDERVKASPLARKIAEQNQVDLRGITGSGPNGRILRHDVEQASVRQPQTAPPSSHPTQAPTVMRSSTLPPGSNQNAGTLTPLSKMRETIAKRMQESVNQAPHFYSTTSIDMGAVVELRETLKIQADFKGLSINHFIIKAAAYALQRESTVNGAMKDGQCYAPAQINIGIITAIEDGLLIPVIREVDNLSLRDLLFEAKAAVERARAGRPNSSDLMGGTFSISNMGMFDVENFTAIINPGQGAVLAVSATREEPVVKAGQVVVAKRMKVTLSVDHRIIDGLMAARWLGFFKAALEQPTLMFV